MKETEQKERERRHRELLESIEKLNTKMSDKLDNQDKKLDTQDKRIRQLENWRWYILGIGAAIIFGLNKLPWVSFFG